MRTRPISSRSVYIDGVFNNTYCVLYAAILGLVVRLVLALAARHNTVFLDERDYENLGTALWKTHQFALSGSYTAFRAPAEPFFICLIYEIVGRHPAIVKLVTS